MAAGEMRSELAFVRYELERMIERRLTAPFSNSERALFEELSARERQLLDTGEAPWEATALSHLPPPA